MRRYKAHNRQAAGASVFNVRAALVIMIDHELLTVEMIYSVLFRCRL